MKFEHFAINLADVRTAVKWYVDNLGLAVGRSSDKGALAHFLADSSGRVFLELYSNPAAPVPAYATMDPLVFHIAFVSTDTAADRSRLEKAGATFVSADELPDGTRLLMMRDPWGVALQFCNRASIL
ncbi:MAG: VOC family protein [Opitutaceae bacterium]|jgi:extradiol dioxygenase family protein|nr:VOC family protein [Opitutaceae bacterium]